MLLSLGLDEENVSKQIASERQVCLLGRLLNVTTRVNRLDVEKVKSLTDLVIEKSVELYGFTPSEKSEENLKWMLENGYPIKQVQKRVRASPWGVDDPRGRKLASGDVSR